MGRREYPLEVHCTENGCREVARYSYQTRRDLETSFELKHIKTYKCLRHSHGSNALSPENLKTEWISPPAHSAHGSRFFGSYGLIVGKGYYANATDFPEGTRIKITVEALLPMAPTSNGDYTE